MKLHEQARTRMHLVGRYGPDGVEVGGRLIHRPLIIAPALLHEDWIAEAAALDFGSLAALWPLDPRILLLGASNMPAGPLKALRRALTARQVALEVMDLGAACRTYNVLAQEDRAVAALLFPD